SWNCTASNARLQLEKSIDLGIIESSVAARQRGRRGKTCDLCQFRRSEFRTGERGDHDDRAFVRDFVCCCYAAGAASSDRATGIRGAINSDPYVHPTRVWLSV